MIVSAASRMFSAISFGVFCRSAPSTSAIMRSRKVSPGSAVIRIVQPVGDDLRAAGDRRADVGARLLEHRRRLAGDGRLVDVGDALDDLAVAGDHLAGLDAARCRPCAARPTDHLLDRPSRSRVAPASRVCVARSVSACALPRASAIASAKLANSTVNQSQSVICET